MLRLLTRMSLVALVLLLAAPAARARPGSQNLADQYIVVLRDDIVDPEQMASEMAHQYGLTVTQVYQHSLQGFAARIPIPSLAAVRADSRVLYVVADQQVGAFGESAPTSYGP